MVEQEHARRGGEPAGGWGEAGIRDDGRAVALPIAERRSGLLHGGVADRAAQPLALHDEPDPLPFGHDIRALVAARRGAVGAPARPREEPGTEPLVIDAVLGRLVLVGQIDRGGLVLDQGEHARALPREQIRIAGAELRQHGAVEEIMAFPLPAVLDQVAVGILEPLLAAPQRQGFGMVPGDAADTAPQAAGPVEMAGEHGHERHPRPGEGRRPVPEGDGRPGHPRPEQAGDEARRTGRRLARRGRSGRTRARGRHRHRQLDRS